MKKTSRAVKVGSLVIGGGAPVSVQGMTRTRTADYAATLDQVRSLAAAGAQLVRLAVRDEADLAAFARLKRKVSLPLAADIHFRGDLALGAIRAGADKLRLNPGNITDREKLRAIIRLAGRRRVAVRVGVNAGSLPRVEPARRPPAEPQAAARRAARAMVAAAAVHIALFEAEDFRDIIVSLKASSVRVTLAANRLFRRRYDYPLHLGVTEAGRGVPAVVKSALGIGALLEAGIGDTIRVSLSRPPEEEIAVAGWILQSLDLRRCFPEIISCPTCGRCRADIFAVLDEVERGLAALPPGCCAGLKIAVMGCEVNGPGEAADADLGVAAGGRFGLLFAGGRVLERVPRARLASRLLEEIARRAAGD